MPTNDPTKRRAIYKTMRVYSGSSNRPLAQKIADILGVELSGLALEQFANGEIYARYEETVRGADVFLIQSIAGENVNDMLMEVMVAAYAAKRALRLCSPGPQGRSPRAHHRSSGRRPARVLWREQHHHARPAPGPDRGLL